MGKHTPGPWMLDYGHVYSEKHGIISDCEFQRNKDAGQSECQANAKLIAAAPEMLEALERLIDSKLDYDSAHDYAVKVIAKAKGGE